MLEVLDLRATAFADDMEVTDAMLSWSEPDIIEYFASGGETLPAAEARMKEPGLETPLGSDGVVAFPAEPATHVVPDEAVLDLNTLSVRELKARCAAARLSTEGCLAKSDLVRRIEDQATHEGLEPPTGEGWWVELTTKDMKRRLERAGVDVSACFERGDFEAQAKIHSCACSVPPSSSGSAVGEHFFWSAFSAKALKQLLADRHISSAGCLDKADLLAAAERHEAVLLAAVPASAPAVATSPSASMETAKAQAVAAKREQVRVGLEALGGVVHGGYQIDLFGRRRGRCIQNTKCFRYTPGNHRINGCAMKGMGAVTCQRCGFQNVEHEDLGEWAEGDPMLVDEHGDGWRFEACVEGTRRVKMHPPAAQPAGRGSTPW